jgi:hypothetical protein
MDACLATPLDQRNVMFVHFVCGSLDPMPDGLKGNGSATHGMRVFNDLAMEGDG